MKPVFYLVSVLLSVLLFHQAAKAQQIAFAEDIKPDGKMVGQNVAFTIPKAGGTIKFLVSLKQQINAAKVVYKVYRLDDKGNKYPDQTINDNVKPEWFWFYNEMFVRSAGSYLVELYVDGSNKVVASGRVKIIEEKD